MTSKTTFFSTLGIYIAIRVFSFYFSPGAAYIPFHYLNSVLAVAILLATVILLFKKNPFGWYVVAGEIILGGAGSFLAIGGISLRSCLLTTSLTIYFLQKTLSGQLVELLRKNKPDLGASPEVSGRVFWKESRLRRRINPNCSFTTTLASWYSRATNKFNTVATFAMVILGGLSGLRGLLIGHQPQAVFSDALPFLYFLYYFPLSELIIQKEFRKFCATALASALIGSFLLMFYVLIGFSSGHYQLQEAFYRWFRYVAGGKITDLNYNFFRIVLNEQLLLVSILMIFLNKFINKIYQRYSVVLSIIILIILSINLTRVYFLALAAGLLLINKKNWQRTLLILASSALIIFISFTAIHLTASRGQSLGWEIFGLRLQSIVSPSLEDSSLSRMILLPKIIDKIKTHPMIGEGLGATVTAYSPILKANVTTPHFDWGYFEIIAESGLLGLLVWLLYIVNIFKNIKKTSSTESRAGLAFMAAILIINLTSPALFHVLGVVGMVYLLAEFKPDDVSAVQPV